MTDHTLHAAIAKLGLTIRSEFVPFSQSRNAAEKSPSLNWRVTLIREGRDILTTDYMAGSAHCPAYKAKVPATWQGNAKTYQGEAIAWECENGKRCRHVTWSSSGFIGASAGKDSAILPNATDVIYSLVSDASVLDCSTFEDWAADLGYDTDSRSAEKIYRACLEIALKLRNGLGEAALSELRDAAQDY